MNITDESVEELQSILQNDLNRQISVQQARKFGEWILRFYSHLQNKNGTGGAQIDVEDSQPAPTTE